MDALYKIENPLENPKKIEEVFFEVMGRKNPPNSAEIEARKHIKRWKWIFKICPFVRGVALCNSLPLGCMDAKSDIDLCVITEKNRMFTARLALTILTQIFGLRRHGAYVQRRFCLSFFADTEHLKFSEWALKPQDLYLAFWIQYLEPITGDETWFNKILEENKVFLSNYFNEIQSFKTSNTPEKNSAIQIWLETLLAPRCIESKLKKWQMRRALAKKNQLIDPSGILINEGLLKFHNQDERAKIQKKCYIRFMNHEAIFAAGCFWGVEESFRTLPGVLETEVGYTGGNTENPSYRQVCNENTNHAEAVRVVFDPKQISYEDLVRHFFKIHNPTTFNRQGPDVGSQYRSAIFTHDAEQNEIAERVKKELDSKGTFPKPIVTQINPAAPFYPAEEYHQKYIMKGGYSACQI